MKFLFSVWTPKRTLTIHTTGIQVVQVDSERKRFSLTLKPSIVASGATDASYVRTLFSDLEAAEAIRTSQEDGGSGAIDWNNALAIGSVVKGSVHKIEEYGVLVDLDAHQVWGRVSVKLISTTSAVSAGSRR